MANDTREIKFRGKTLVGNRWAHGYYACVEGRHYIILDDAEVSVGEYGDHVINGFVEVDGKTVETWERIQTMANELQATIAARRKGGE